MSKAKEAIDHEVDEIKILLNWIGRDNPKQALRDMGYTWNEATALTDLAMVFADRKVVSGTVSKG